MRVDVRQAIIRYADRFSSVGSGQHHVASPLGAWLVLALAGSAADGARAEQLADVLGMDTEAAARAAGELLSDPHPAVAAAAAAWTDLASLDGWLTTLPDAVQTGPVPTKPVADQWARDHTFGLINEFPLEDAATFVILLASALATKVTWLEPFDVCPSKELRSAWSDEVGAALRSPVGYGHSAQIVDSSRAGRIGVHRALADDVEVTAVIADENVSAADVLAAAHEVACNPASAGNRPVSLFDLPLGDQPLWTITERDADDAGERADAVLPAWSASSTHDLLETDGLGFEVAGQALAERAGLRYPIIEAVQSAVARYSRTGFEAAAVTALGVAVSARMPQPGKFREATVRFGHPFAVVATTFGQQPDSVWHNLPVFSAWVTSPDDAAD